MYLLYSKEERTYRTAHTGNIMDVARIASKDTTEEELGKADLMVGQIGPMQKSGLSSQMNLCRANSGEKEKEKKGIGRLRNIRMLVRVHK